MRFLTVGQQRPECAGGCYGTVPLGRPQYQWGAQLRTNFLVPTKWYHSAEQALSTNSRLMPQKMPGKEWRPPGVLGGKTDLPTNGGVWHPYLGPHEGHKQWPSTW